MMKTRILLDSHGFYYTMRLSVGSEPKHGIPFACYALCEQQIRRPHLTCLWCRARRVHYKLLKEKIPVEILTIAINKQQKYPRLKAIVRKMLFTLMGWTLN